MRWLLTCTGEDDSFPAYEAWVRAAGAEPVTVGRSYVAPPVDAAFAALLLPGGGDVDPARYGAARHACTGHVLARRDELEFAMIDAFRRRGLPVFGICRGLQVLNVALGGALLQHVPDVVPVRRERHGQKDRCDSRHPVQADPTTRLGVAISAAVDVNSSHHQAVDPARLGAGLRVAARSAAGIIEAVEIVAGRAPIFAVQWHPERLPLDHPASSGLRVLFAAVCAR